MRRLNMYTGRDKSYEIRIKIKARQKVYHSFEQGNIVWIANFDINTQIMKLTNNRRADTKYKIQ